MSHVFISYSKKNKSYALKLADYLITSGFDVWIDDRIDYGAAWEDAIQKAIEDCAAFIVIMSTDSRKSQWVRAECEYAAQNGKLAFPLLLEGSVFFRFVSVQYVNVTDGSLPPEAFLQELAEHAPRKQGSGEDVTLPEVSEEKSMPPPSFGERLASARPAPVVTQTAPPPVQQSQQPRRRGRLVLVTGLLAALVLVAAAAIFLRQYNSGFGYGQTITGELTADAPTQSYTFRGAAGDSIYIKLTAEDFDCYVSLLDETGSEITYDDDSGGDHDSLIDGFVLPADGVYTIVVLSFDYRNSGTVVTGDYSLTLRLADTEQISAAPTETETSTPTEIVPTETPPEDAEDTEEDPSEDTSEDTSTSSVSPVSSNGDWTPVTHTFNGVEMALVPPGCFAGTDGDVCFDSPFWIDRLEVSNSAFALIDEPLTGAAADWPDENQPRTNVTALESEMFCEWRGARLPTQEEWEYAARGPDGWEFPWGDEFDPDLVVYEANSDAQPAPVDSHSEGASWVGALNMSGNVWEWTATETEAGLAVKRGGSFADVEDDISTSAASEENLNEVFADIGFRCAMDYSEEVLAILAYPDAGQVISEDTSIFGTALFSPFRASHYTIEMSGGQLGDEWTQLHEEHSGSVVDAWLEVIHANSLEPGDYRLRLHIPLLDGESVYSGEVPFSIGTREEDETVQTSECETDWFFGSEDALEGDCPLAQADEFNGIIQGFRDGKVIAFEVRSGEAQFLILKGDATVYNTNGAWNLEPVHLLECLYDTTRGILNVWPFDEPIEEMLGCPNYAYEEETFQLQVSDSGSEFIIYIGTSSGDVYRFAAPDSTSDSEGIWQRIR